MRMRAALAAAAAVLVVCAPARAADPACAPWPMRTVASGLGILENLEFDGHGGLFLSANGAGAILRMTPDGATSTVVPDVTGPGGLRLRGDTLYFNTGDSAQSGVLGTNDGTLDAYDVRTHKRRTVASGLFMPNGLAFLPDGSAVVSRDLGSGSGITRIVDGRPQFSWAKLDDQNGLAVDPTGTWLYADQTFTADSSVWRIRIAKPSEMSVVKSLGVAKGLDDMTIDGGGVLYAAANGSGEVIRLDPRTGSSCVIASGLMNPSSLKFARGDGFPRGSLYVTGFDGTVRELRSPVPVKPAATPKAKAKKKPKKKHRH